MCSEAYYELRFWPPYLAASHEGVLEIFKWKDDDFVQARQALMQRYGRLLKEGVTRIEGHTIRRMQIDFGERS